MPPHLRSQTHRQDAADTVGAELIQVAGAMEILHERGDIIIVAGSDESNQYKFLASSAVLEAASKVFAALLSGRYAEGHNLSTVSPPEVILEDDDSAALTTLLRLCHFRCSGVNQNPIAQELLTLAVTADKYALYGALTCPFTIWINQIDAAVTTTSDRIGLASAAFVFGLHEQFRRYTATLVLCHKDSFIDLSRENDVLPQQNFRKRFQHFTCTFADPRTDLM